MDSIFLLSRRQDPQNQIDLSSTELSIIYEVCLRETTEKHEFSLNLPAGPQNDITMATRQ